MESDIKSFDIIFRLWEPRDQIEYLSVGVRGNLSVSGKMPSVFLEHMVRGILEPIVREKTALSSL